MSLNSTLTQLKTDIETQITEYGAKGITPPAHLLELRYYLLGGSSSSGGSSGGGTSTDMTETNSLIGAKSEVKATSITASSGLNGLLRLLIDTFLTKIPVLTLVGNALKVDGSAVTQPVSGTVNVASFPATQAISATSLPLPNSAATDGMVQAVRDRTGEKDEATPATDTASSGLNGRLQRIAVRLSSLIGLLPTELSNGRLKVDNSAVTQPISATSLPLPSLAATDAMVQAVRDRLPVSGQATAATSTPVVLSSDGPFSTNFGLVADTVASSDTPSNVSFIGLFKRLLSKIPQLTLVSNALKVDGSSVTQPISAASLPLPASAATDSMVQQVRDRLLLSEATLITEDSLTAVGSTTARSMAGFNKLTYQIDVTGIGANVVVRAEGNNTGSSYGNLSATRTDTTLFNNGTYLFTYSGKLGNTRFTLVSISGGTPSLAINLLRGN